MVIGIDASRAFLKRRTGIEEYSYQVIRHLRGAIPVTDRVVLYVRKSFEIRNSKFEIRAQKIDFELPSNWSVRALWSPRLWTQARLSWEMLFHGPDVLFVPAHVVPIVHPKRTVVTVHGLEYEVFPGAYSFLERLYMRLSIRFSVRAASRVVAVSENTKRDLMRLYGVPEGKISVIYEGISQELQIADCRLQIENTIEKPYLLFVGRLEERKNVIRIIKAFEILKRKHGIPHELVLVGKPGFGYEKIRYEIRDTRYEIRETGYVSEGEKVELLKNADVFLFPTLYEGFGLPVLEAQSLGVPVVTSGAGSLPEVAGDGAVFSDPLSAESIASGIGSILSDRTKRGAIIEKGLENVKRFGWKKCADSIVPLLK